jgi:RNA polymerase sigma-70 factor (ECF subfamily)
MKSYSRDFIQRLKKKDGRAIEELYRTTVTNVYNYILYKVNGNANLAEEVLSEVYCKAIDYLPSLTFTHNVLYWLFRIAKTKIIDHYRKLKKEKKFTSLRMRFLEFNLHEQMQNLSPEAALLKHEHKLLIKAAFMKLSEEYRDILYKKYVKEMRVDEIAGELKRTEKSVESILYRGRNLFRNELNKLNKEGYYFDKDTWEEKDGINDR